MEGGIPLEIETLNLRSSSFLISEENASPDEAVAETSILDIPKLIVVEEKRDFASLSLEEILDSSSFNLERGRIQEEETGDDGVLQPLIFIVCCSGAELVSYKCSTEL